MGCADIVTREFTKGDLLRKVRAVLQNADGTVVDLTAQTVKFRMVNAATGTVKVNELAATIDSAVNGQVSYTWLSADIDTAGEYWAQFIRVSSGNEDHHPPGRGFKIIIREEV